MEMYRRHNTARTYRSTIRQRKSEIKLQFILHMLATALVTLIGYIPYIPQEAGIIILMLIVGVWMHFDYKLDKLRGII